ncbi:MAG: RHS repeat-associated core domain-containing protein, partial [Myxococcota bacterium]
MNYQQNLQHSLTQKTSSLQSKSPAHVGQYVYDEKKIHAVMKAGTRAMGYDPSGCRTQSGMYAYDWDFAGRLSHTKIGGETVGRYWYNESRMRTLKEEQGILSMYPFEDFRIVDGQVSLLIKHGYHLVAEWRSPKMLAQIYDDLVPDQVINAADAWLYHATRLQIVNKKLKVRPVDVDLTRSMLQAGLSRLLDGDGDKLYTLHTDHLGSVRQVTDSVGQVIHKKRYYPYGALQAKSGAFRTLDFQGKEKDLLTGNHYFGARYMNARLGQWLSPDPAFERAQGPNDEWNGYAKVLNNPLRYRDQDGYFMEEATATAMVLGTAMSLAYAIGFGDASSSS